MLFTSYKRIDLALENTRDTDEDDEIDNNK
jgi:hypothetical protein